MTNSEERIDALIDDVARHMTEGAPAADFTARVLQRIDERQPRLRWRWVWVAAPLVAAAVVLIAMQMVRLKPDATEGKPNAVDAQSIVRSTPPLDVTRGGPQVVEGPNLTDTRPRATRPTQNVAEVRSSSTIDALAPPRLDVTPLDVAPLDARVTSPDSIEVEHLETIAPIAVMPLDVR